MNRPLVRFPMLLAGLLAFTVFVIPKAARAQQEWRANVGGESPDMGKQALAFLPDEIWIHAGDSITWTFQSDEIHTLTFLMAGQFYPPAPSNPPNFNPPFVVGCPGFSSNPATFDGSTCVSSPTMVKGQKFTVKFPTAGSYKFECLVHNTMTGTIYVLNPGEILPHDQVFYDREASKQKKALLSDANESMQMNMRGDGDHDGDDDMPVEIIRGNKQVVAGVGEISSTPGGLQTGSVVRFLNGTITIHAGDTVEWGNNDPEEAHTITFGPEPAPQNQFPPSVSGNASLSTDPDGVLHATITKAKDYQVHSGFIEQPLEDEPGVPQNTLANNPTLFRVTFIAAGTYSYKCVLHDNLGMVGKVIVLP